MSRYQYVHKQSRSLILDTTICALPDWFVKVVTRKTEKLRYVKGKGLNNILVEYDRGKLHRLKHLFIIGPNGELKELMNTITWIPNKPVFENLIELHLENVDSLKELCVGELPPASLFNLKSLTVRCCHSLENVLLPSKLLQRLSNLEILTCWEMNGMKYVFGCEGFEPEQSRLRELTVYNLSSVISTCNRSAPRAMFQTLKSLSIVRCNFGGSLFIADVAYCLFQLESLFVVSCAFLERVIEEREETVNKKKMVLPKLKSLVLEKLPMLYMSGSDTIDIECASLEYLYVKECPQFSASTPDFQSKNQVQLLDRLPHMDLVLRRFIDHDPWGNQNRAFNAFELLDKIINKSAEKAMPGMIEKRPDFMDKMPGWTESMPEFKDKLHILMEVIPELKEIIPELMENMQANTMSPEWIKKTSELWEMLESTENVPKMMDNMPKYMEILSDLMEMMPELTENMPASFQMRTRRIKRMSESMKKVSALFNKMLPESEVQMPALMQFKLELAENWN